MRRNDGMAGLLEDSDSNSGESLRSIESDEDPLLPSYADVIRSPSKKIKVEPPAVKIPGPISSLLIGSTQCSPSHDSIPPPPPPPPPPLEDSLQDSLEDSPLKMGHDHKKAIKKGEKLSKKMRQLSESGRMRKDMTEKLEKYKSQGGILGLSKILEDQGPEEDELLDNVGLSSLDSDSVSELPKLDSIDDTPSLPLNPPGKSLFVNPPLLIEELYPPCAEITPQEGPLEGMKRMLLSQDSTEGLTLLLTSEWLGLCYKENPCPLSIWQWLFQIMCRSCDQLLSKGAFSNLVDLVKRAKAINQVDSIFSPSMADVIDILVTLGVDRERLSRNDLPHQENDNVFESSQSIFVNLCLLLRYLRLCVETCPEHYTVEELEELIMIIFNISLDTNVHQEVIPHDITVCIGSLVTAIPSSHWACSVERLASSLSTLSVHHHDKLYIARLITGMTDRLSTLQFSVCRKSIESLLAKMPSTSTQTSTEFARSILVYYYSLKSPNFDYEMCYKTRSILAMLSLFMNISRLVWSDSKLEKEFAQLLGVLSDKVRDHPNYPERGVVKDLLIQMKLEFEGQKSIKRQTGMNAYTTYKNDL